MSTNKTKCQTEQDWLSLCFPFIFSFLFVWPYILAFPCRQVGGGDKDSRKIYGTKFTVGWDFKMPKLKHQALI
jgi:hypothetical protein